MKMITARERELVKLLGKGLSSKEIADVLRISFYTVESQRRILRAKFSTQDLQMLVQKVQAEECND